MGRSVDSLVVAHKKPISKAKAKKILREGKIGEKPLTKKAKGFFGARAGGAPVRRKRKR